MGRDNEGLQRRVAEPSASTDTEDSSDEEQTYALREGAARSLDVDEIELRVDSAMDDAGDAARLQAQIGSGASDPRLSGPGALPQITDVSGIGPDGSSIDGGGLTSPTGDTLGGIRQSGAFESALGGRGSRGVDQFLAPLGGSSGPDSDLGGFGIDSRRGISLTDDERTPGTDAHFNLVNEQRGARDENPLTRDEYETQYGIGGSGGADDSEEGGSASWRPEGISPAAWQAAEDFHTETMVSWVKEYGVAEVFPSDDDGMSAAEELAASTYDFSGGDDEDDERPDPTAGYDVLTGEAVGRAVAAHGPGVYSQPAQDGGDSGGNATAIAWNAPASDPRITNYGPDGPQRVEVGDNWAPPADLIFDPPAEGASAGAVGEASGSASGAASGASAPAGTTGGAAGQAASMASQGAGADSVGAASAAQLTGDAGPLAGSAASTASGAALEAAAGAGGAAAGAGGAAAGLGDQDAGAYSAGGAYAAGSAGMAALGGDPAAALGGSEVVGSSTPDEAPPPPDPPPGEDPDQGPLGPPGGGGADNG